MNDTMNDFLVEIHTEELPPKALLQLGKAFLQHIQNLLQKAELSFSEGQFFATPCRLAVLIKNLIAKQGDTYVERKGPALEAAFDKNGHPTPACLGFAKSCGTTPEKLDKIENTSGAWVGFKQFIPGKMTMELLPTIIQEALIALPIPKRMRWGNNTAEFVRPVHSVLLLYGEEVIKTIILGCHTSNLTRGHRFLSSGWIKITTPATYAAILEKNFVIADFYQRRKKIREASEKLITNQDERVVISDALLDEVTGLVEWPVVILGHFDKTFLHIPQEALISAMQDHQRYFHVMDSQNKLLPYFVIISNIQSQDESRVIKGNERVLRARLSDAAFFFEVDKKQSLENRLTRLKLILFQAKLGSLYDKSERLAYLSQFIAKQIHEDIKEAERVAWLAKTDLTTELVGEFPELQGIAGYYYALHDQEKESVAKAISEQYSPRFSGDCLPATYLGCVISIADRMDTLVGIFGINQQPTGDKDPFGLRRATLGVLRILIEKKLNLDLHELLLLALKNYKIPLDNKNVVQDVLHFMLDRLKPFYLDQSITPDVLASVLALNITKPFDFHCRIEAVQAFKNMSEAESLSVANKRVSHILAKYPDDIMLSEIDETLFESDVERNLSDKLKEQQEAVMALSHATQYQEALTRLACLRQPVDAFFDHVLVMTDDKPKRENRLLMLKKLRELFLQVADVALLGSGMK